MIQLDIPMPKCCDYCRLCLIKYTDDDDSSSSAYCCGAEKYIVKACDGKDITVATAVLNKPQWCPLKEVQTMVDEILLMEDILDRQE